MPNDNSSLDTVSRDVANLSSAFGEAQAFATHRVIEYHHWMLAKSGHLIRCFAYIGETGRLLANTGTLTDAESKIKLFKLPQERWQPNESDVMAVAADWSFDPTQLTSKSPLRLWACSASFSRDHRIVRTLPSQSLQLLSTVAVDCQLSAS